MGATTRRHLIIDAMNVIGSRPDGWWRDPDAAKRRLVQLLRVLADQFSETISVIIDGRPVSDLAEGEHGGIRVFYATRSGPNAADDRIVELIAERPEGVTVVTSDRELRRRIVELGGDVQGTRWLLTRLDRGDRAGSSHREEEDPAQTMS